MKYGLIILIVKFIKYLIFINKLEFLDEVRKEFHEKLNALFEVGSNDNEKIHRILNKIAKKNIHFSKDNEWWMLSGYN